MKNSKVTIGNRNKLDQIQIKNKTDEKEVSTKDDGPSAAGCLITVSVQNKLTVTLKILQEVLNCLVSAFSCHSVAHSDEEIRYDNQCKYPMCFFPKSGTTS